MNRPDILATILATKRLEASDATRRRKAEDWDARCRDLPPPRDFAGALAGRFPVGVIAEIKRASPSAGILREDFDPVGIARSYAENGADCVSVLTDREFFRGGIEHLQAVAAAVNLPVLRKDFVIDESQVIEARIAGAAAVLLIAECLEPRRLAELASKTTELGMTPLVELHDPENLPAVIASKAPVACINNRDLRTFETRLEMTQSLAGQFPEGTIVVSESGIRTADDVALVRSFGASAILVGEAFMRAEDPGARLRLLMRETAKLVAAKAD